MANFNMYAHELPEDDMEPSAALMVVEPEQHGVQLVPPTRLPDNFASEQYFQTDNFLEATHFCAEHFAYDRHPTSFAQISLDSELVLSVESQQYRLTERAYHDLCAIVNIPLTFGTDIPPDLAAIVVERLKARHQQALVPVSRGDTIVSLVDPLKWKSRRETSAQERTKNYANYLPVPNLSLLRLLEKVWSDAAADTRITITDTGIQIEIVLMDDAFKLEPIAGDVTRIGMVVKSSETGGPLPHATEYTMRLICRNGATVRHEIEPVYFNSDWNWHLERRMHHFAGGLHDLLVTMQDKRDQLQMTYKRMVQEPLTDVQFYNFYRQAQYASRGIAGSDQLDAMFGVTSSRRQELFKQVRDRQKEMRNGTTAVIEPHRATDLLAWQAFNGITAAARDEVRYNRRTALESLAGDVMKPFMASIPSLN
jgi:hypothetical protein